jgi:hypothetical protein
MMEKSPEHEQRGELHLITITLGDLHLHENYPQQPPREDVGLPGTILMIPERTEEALLFNYQEL